MTKFDFPALCTNLQEMVLDRLDWKQRLELLSVNSSLRLQILYGGPFGDRIDKLAYQFSPRICNHYVQLFEHRHRLKIDDHLIPNEVHQIRFLPLFQKVASVRWVYLDALPDDSEVPLVVSIYNQLGSVADLDFHLLFMMDDYQRLFEDLSPRLRATRCVLLNFYHPKRAKALALKGFFELHIHEAQKISIDYLNGDGVSQWLDLLALTEAKTIFFDTVCSVRKKDARAYLKYMFDHDPPSEDGEIGWHFKFDPNSRIDQMLGCVFVELLEARTDLDDISEDGQLVDWLEEKMPAMLTRSSPLLYRGAYRKSEPDDGGVQLYCLLTARHCSDCPLYQLDFKWLPSPPPANDD